VNPFSKSLQQNTEMRKKRLFEELEIETKKRATVEKVVLQPTKSLSKIDWNEVVSQFEKQEPDPET